MKKFVSVMLASAMAASMSVAAFADVSFGSGSNSDVQWPTNFAFSGKLTVVDKEENARDVAEGEKLELHPGDTLYLPLYHDKNKEVPAEEGDATPEKETVQYVGQVGKDWRIHFSSQSKGRVQDAEFYSADANDAFLTANALYVKITMDKSFDSVKTDKVSFGVYVGENRTKNKTNQVAVKADFANNNVGYVDCDWVNAVYGPSIFEVAKNEDGEATFDFADEATFKVKMYSEEKVLLDLSRNFDKDIALAYDEDAEYDFFNFRGSHDSFSRTGVLSLEAGANDYVYEVVDGELTEIDFDYNSKTKMIEIKTADLGYYVVVDRELDVESVNTEDDTTNNTSKPQPDKNNPAMGANDFAGAAVAMAVVSIAAAGALALKK